MQPAATIADKSARLPAFTDEFVIRDSISTLLSDTREREIVLDGIRLEPWSHAGFFIDVSAERHMTGLHRRGNR